MDPRLRVALMAPAAIALALYLAALIYMAVEQRRFVYYPSGDNVAPASVGLATFSVRHIRTTDGENLLAWYAAPAPRLHFELRKDGHAIDPVPHLVPL